MLNGAGIVTLIRQVKAGSVSKHMWMHWERQISL
jgi:hypothetical protein